MVDLLVLCCFFEKFHRKALSLDYMKITKNVTSTLQNFVIRQQLSRTHYFYDTKDFCIRAGISKQAIKLHLKQLRGNRKAYGRNHLIKQLE